MDTGNVDVWRLFSAGALVVVTAAIAAALLDFYLRPRKYLPGESHRHNDESNGPVASNGYPKP